MYSRAREPRRSDAKQILENEQLESAVEYVSRERRIAWLRGPIFGYPDRCDGFGPTAVHDAILAMNLDDEKRPIYVMVHSAGGSVVDGLILYDAIRASKAPVTTVLQFAGSMATVVAVAGHRRLIYPRARVMLHLPTAGQQGDFKELASAQKEVERLSNTIADCYIECGVKKPRKLILKDIDRQFWMDAEECIAYGLVDAVSTSEEMIFGGMKGRTLMWGQADGEELCGIGGCIAPKATCSPAQHAAGGP